MSRLTDEEIIYWSTRVLTNIYDILDELYLQDTLPKEKDFNYKKNGVMKFYKTLLTIAKKRNPTLRMPFIVYQMGNS